MPACRFTEEFAITTFLVLLRESNHRISLYHPHRSKCQDHVQNERLIGMEIICLWFIGIELACLWPVESVWGSAAARPLRKWDPGPKTISFLRPSGTQDPKLSLVGPKIQDLGLAVALLAVLDLGSHFPSGTQDPKVSLSCGQACSSRLGPDPRIGWDAKP